VEITLFLRKSFVSIWKTSTNEPPPSTELIIFSPPACSLVKAVTALRRVLRKSDDPYSDRAVPSQYDATKYKLFCFSSHLSHSHRTRRYTFPASIPSGKYNIIIVSPLGNHVGNHDVASMGLFTTLGAWY